MNSDLSNYHILSVLVENRPGVMARISGLFARRGFNIHSLAVAPTDDPKQSRFTIVVDVEDTPLEQIIKQLYKLIHVLRIDELSPEDAVEREMLLITVRTGEEARSEVIELVQVFEGKIVDVGYDALTIMLAGAPQKLDDFEDLMRPFGIKEIQRTGRIAMPKLVRLEPKLRAVKNKAG